MQIVTNFNFMKKKFLTCVCALGLLAAIGYGVKENVKSNAILGDLALANVEALADSEERDKWGCKPSKTIVCYWGSSGEVRGEFYWK